MNYPTITQAETADRLQLCNWYRHLRSPQTDAEVTIMDTIARRWRETGGFTPEISKQVGWTIPSQSDSLDNQP